MIIPSNLNDNKHVDKVTNQNTKIDYDITTKVDLHILDNMQIKREVYYKMNFIMKYLENHWAIKKRKNIFFLKNLETSSKEIITEDYLNRRIVEKLYTSATNEVEHIENGETRETREIKETNKTHPQKTKKDIIPLEDGIKALRHMIENQKMDINNELKNKIYVMHFVMNTLENGWTIRKNNDNFIFRKKHRNRDEVYSDDYLINFLKINTSVNQRVNM
jgi:hypothetical protein